MNIRLDGQVAVVTGAGQGLGRSHALALAARGAKILVNDLGSGQDGSGESENATAVAKEICDAGGDALAWGANITDAGQCRAMIEAAMARWGRIDILVNNAGMLRDRSFAKMTMDDFRAVIDVHLMGAMYLTQAVWPIMREQNYGRIVMTTSSSGLFGNFGQANYATAKMALVGAMQTLGIEGERYGIRTNCIAPVAATAMTAGIIPEEDSARLDPQNVSDGVVFLVSKDAPNRCILSAGAGSFEAARIVLTRGIVAKGPDAPEQIANQFEALMDIQNALIPADGGEQGRYELSKLG